MPTHHHCIHAEPPSPSLPAHSSRPHRALHVYEILSAILSYALSQPLDTVSDATNPDWSPFHDAYGISHQSPLPSRWRLRGEDHRRADSDQVSVRLVCRWWYQVAQSFRPYHPYALSLLLDLRGTPVDLDRLAACRGLYCQLPYWRLSAVDTRWARVIQRLDTMSEDCVSLSTESMHRSSFLREVFLSSVYRMDDHLKPFLAIPLVNYSITLLDLSFQGNDPIDITVFFSKRGPVPHNGRSPSSPSRDLVLPYLRHFHIRHAVISPLPDDWTLAQPSRLCSLSVVYCSMDSADLTTLLRALCGPALRHLGLGKVFLASTTSHPWWNETTFLRLPVAVMFELSQRCPRLQSIEVDEPKVITAFKEAGFVLGKLRSFRTEKWRFKMEPLVANPAPITHTTMANTNVTPGIDKKNGNNNYNNNNNSWVVTATDHHPSRFTWHSTPVLTHLEINDGLHKGSFHMEELCNFLCEKDQVGHLLSFKARGVSFDIQHLYPVRQRRWACRNLRVFEFRVGTWNRAAAAANKSSSSSTLSSASLSTSLLSNSHTSDGRAPTETSPPTASKNPTKVHECSRRIFGFIAMSFPLLTDLFLSSWMINVAEGEGGLCFLSRMKHLQRVTLQAQHEELWGQGIVVRSILPRHRRNCCSLFKLLWQDYKDWEGKLPWRIVDPWWWMERDPSHTSILARHSSLRFCERIASLDKAEEDRAWWPTTTTTDTTATILEAPSSPGAPRQEGCLWESMERITFNVIGGPRSKAITESLLQMKCIRPDIDFQMKTVAGLSVAKYELSQNYML